MKENKNLLARGANKIIDKRIGGVGGAYFLFFRKARELFKVLYK